jgi:BirA family biotin operon repressor/biotin-[acetyl-CoA-carboxylase] ligase
MSRSGLGPIRRFDEIDSTNRYLADEARLGAPHGLVAVAAYQTAGRGRLGRRWDAPPGANLLVSVLLRPGGDLGAAHTCTLALALSAADSCKETADVDPGLKWPNDLVVGDRKLAGILAESITGGRGGPAVVIGLGLNIGWPSEDPPADVPDKSTSLVQLSDSAVESEEVLTSLLEHLDRRITVLLGREGTAVLGPDDLELQPEARRELLGEYRRRCVTLGRHVRVEEPKDSFTGVAIEITDQGQLVVETPEGRRVVMAGDVVHVRHQVE